MSRSASRRLDQIAAYLAAPLWALQAPIWIAAPKVQEQTVPYRITNPVLFELFWLSIAGAVAFSAAAARPITRRVGAPVSRLSRTSAAVAVLALVLATAATVCIALAPIAALQAVAITVLTNLLNGAALILAVCLTLSAVACWRIRRTAGRLGISMRKRRAAGVDVLSFLADSRRGAAPNQEGRRGPRFHLTRL